MGLRAKLSQDMYAILVHQRNAKAHEDLEKFSTELKAK